VKRAASSALRSHAVHEHDLHSPVQLYSSERAEHGLGTDADCGCFQEQQNPDTRA